MADRERARPAEAARRPSGPGLWLKRIGAAAILVWCVIAAVSAYLATRQPRQDPAARLDAEFSAFAGYLPNRGEIGYLEPHQDAGSEDAVRTRYLAQYALSPRVVVARVGPEFVIVALDAAHPQGDPRLEGYAHVTTVRGGHRLFRRLSDE